MWKACTITFSLSIGYTAWEKAIGLIAAKNIDAAKIITHEMPLEEVEAAFESVEQMQAVKAILIP
jgi:threonine dehydrogenase-like Zn-dependent dehydrogenase